MNAFKSWPFKTKCHQRNNSFCTHCHSITWLPRNETHEIFVKLTHSLQNDFIISSNLILNYGFFPMQLGTFLSWTIPSKTFGPFQSEYFRLGGFWAQKNVIITFDDHRNKMLSFICYLSVATLLVWFFLARFSIAINFNLLLIQHSMCIHYGWFSAIQNLGLVTECQHKLSVCCCLLVEIVHTQFLALNRFVLRSVHFQQIFKRSCKSQRAEK